MKTFEIWFHDLNEDAQKRYLEFQRVSCADELNADLAPLAMIDVEDNCETDL